MAESQLRDLLARTDLDRLDKILLCLAIDADTPKEVKSIRTIASTHGLRSIKTWNVSGYLSRSGGKASRVPDGWILTSDGRKTVAAFELAEVTVISHTSAALRTHVAKLKHVETRSFVEEAISCFEAKQYRASILLTWVGAVSLLYDHVLANCLQKFNAEALRRNVKHKPITTRDDLARLKESDFLEYLESCSVIGKSVKKELSVCLDLRNGCGHPNSLKVAEARVAAHVETLILNVYSKF